LSVIFVRVHGRSDPESNPHNDGEMILRVNFINILQANFMCADPESAKRQSSRQSLLRFLGSSHPKAARRMLMKLTPDVTQTSKHI